MKMGSTLLGLVLAVASVIFTMIFEDTNLLSFVQVGALVIILGGSFSACIISFSMKEFFNFPGYVMHALFPPKINFKALIVSFIQYSEKARRDGILILEEEVKNMDDETMRAGMQLVIDGADPEIIAMILENIAAGKKKHEKVASEFFEALGGFSPTMGIIGTVMGLVKVLENLGSGNTATLGEGIAVAFIATFYGIGFANLFWLPIANHLKYIGRDLEIQLDIIIAGILAIQNGDNPRIVAEKLVSLITDPGMKKEMEAEVLMKD
jgi:chemotaxis protein MotA